MTVSTSPESAELTDNFLKSAIPQSDPKALNSACAALESGELIVAPTDTRYGLLCRADRAEVVERLYLIKRRPAELALAVFLPTVSSISLWAEISQTAATLIEKFLPGPLTLVLPASDIAIKTLSPKVIGQSEIGIRVIDSEFVSSLLQRVSFPVTATSANLSGTKEQTCAAEIAEQLKSNVALFSVTLYIDAGELTGKVSTVVRCCDKAVEVLRQGAISIEKLQAALGDDTEVKSHV